MPTTIQNKALFGKLYRYLAMVIPLGFSWRLCYNGQVKTCLTGELIWFKINDYYLSQRGFC